MANATTTTTTTQASTGKPATPATTPKQAYPLAPATVQAALRKAGAYPHAVGTNGHGTALYKHCQYCWWAFSSQAGQALRHCQVPAACAKRVACLATGAPVVLARNTPAVPYALGATYKGCVAGGTGTPTVPVYVAKHVRSATGKAQGAPWAPWAAARKAGQPAAVPPAKPAATRKASGKATTGSKRPAAPKPAAPKLHSGSAGTVASGAPKPATAPAAAPATPAVLAGVGKPAATPAS